MTFTKSFIVLIISLIYSKAEIEKLSDNDAVELWNHFTFAFGPLESVTSSLVLKHAVDLASGKDVTTPSIITLSEVSQANKKAFGCMTYNAGIELSRQKRLGFLNSTAGQPLLIPFRKDRASNRLCFIYEDNLTPVAKDQFIFKYAIPPVITLNNGILKMIENLANNTVPSKADEGLMLALYTYLDDDAAMKILRSQIIELENYDMTSLDKAYWTHTHTARTMNIWSTRHVLTSTSAQITSSTSRQPQHRLFPQGKHNADVKLHQQWTALAKHLRYSIGKHSIEHARGMGSISSKSDVCNFVSSVIYEARFFSGKVTLPISKILGINDNSLAAACLMYLVSHLTQGLASTTVFHAGIETPIKLFNYNSRSIMQSATLSSQLTAMPYTKAGLTGSGQVVAV